MEQPSLLQLLAQIEPSDGESANGLLTEFFLGRRPINELAEALNSNDDNVVQQASWITSELGRQALPLLRSVYKLLHHPLPCIRQMSLETVFVCSTPENGEELAAGLTLLCDESPTVRRRACFFCARTSHEKLRAGISQLQNEPVTESAPLLRALVWLVSPEASDLDKVKVMAMSSDPTSRTLGILAAARLGELGAGVMSTVDPGSDEGIAAFIRDRLATLSR